MQDIIKEWGCFARQKTLFTQRRGKSSASFVRGERKEKKNGKFSHTRQAIRRTGIFTDRHREAKAEQQETRGKKETTDPR
ncbi:MAG: hypothetical protein GQ468_05705 [Candidatus Scalindua sp.]|jgi:hypothetical protein|nr:hypothetical protein [Candidatus Scalindua sp.]